MSAARAQGHPGAAEPSSLGGELGRLQERHGRRVATAESCTGGTLAAAFVEIPGSGTWYKGGVVAYDSEVKFSVLGVRRGPVVCATVARQMARGVRELLDADVALATTGVAGPETQEGVPVGTVYVALATSDGCDESREYRLDGTPEEIRSAVDRAALDMLLEHLRSLVTR